MVFLYGLVVLYIYALAAFAFYRMIFNAETGQYCFNMYQCFITSIRIGLIDGMYDVSVCCGQILTVYDVSFPIFHSFFFIVAVSLHKHIYGLPLCMMSFFWENLLWNLVISWSNFIWYCLYIRKTVVGQLWDIPCSPYLEELRYIP